MKHQKAPFNSRNYAVVKRCFRLRSINLLIEYHSLFQPASMKLTDRTIYQYSSIYDYSPLTVAIIPLASPQEIESTLI